MEATYTDPSTTDPQVYDKAINPRATAWFKTTAHHLLAWVDGYLELGRCYISIELHPPDNEDAARRLARFTGAGSATERTLGSAQS